MKLDTAALDQLCYQFGPFQLDAARRSLGSGTDAIVLTAKTFDLLLELVESHGQLATRDQLVQALWPDTLVEENSLSWYVSVLRKALGDNGGSTRYIETVRGRGYRFVAPVTVVAAPTGPSGDEPGDGVPDPEDRGREPASRLPASPAAVASPVRRPRRDMLIALCAAALVAALASAGWFGRRLPPPPLPAPSIAVLPFEYLSADQGGAYLAHGIQDTILTKLAGIAALKVIARTSTERVPARPDDPGAIGRDLGVASLLEGSVQQEGDKLLINVQLIDARSREHLWAQAYERPLKNVFAVESDVAERVADALRAKLLPAEAAQVARAPTTSPEAYDLFLKAEYLALPIEENRLRDSAAPVAEATALYRQAIALDPDFALAQARLSYLQIYAYWWLDRDMPSRVDDALGAAQRALDLQPDLPQAHLAKGYALYWGRRDYAAATAAFNRALDLQPNYPAAIGGIAYIQRRQGKWQDSIDGIERAALLDPNNPWWPHELATLLLQLRRYPDALAQFDRALIIEPGDHEAAIHRGFTLLWMGRIGEAREALAKLPSKADSKGEVSGLAFQIAWYARDPEAALAALADAPPWLEQDLPTSLARAWAWELKGDREHARAAYADARELLEGSLDGNGDDSHRLGMLGLALAGLGDKDAALQAGRRAVEKTPVAQDSMDGPLNLEVMAEIHAQFGDVDEAIEWLQKAAATPSGMALPAATLELDPTWDPIREDPRFKALVTELTAHDTDAGALRRAGIRAASPAPSVKPPVGK